MAVCIGMEILNNRDSYSWINLLKYVLWQKM